MRFALRLIFAVLATVIALRPVQADTPISVLPVIDFESYFPWLVWISSEGHDSEYPSGFRYKLISIRTADSSTIEFALVRQLTDGTKIIAIHAKGPLSKFDESSARVLETMSRSVNVTFQRFDLRDVKDLASLNDKIREYGWDSSELPKVVIAGPRYGDA
jgi:hypothetical protein